MLAVITGASAGIGAEFARQLRARGLHREAALVEAEYKAAWKGAALRIEEL